MIFYDFSMPYIRKMSQQIQFEKHLVEQNNKNRASGKKRTRGSCDNLVFNSWKKSGIGSAALKMISGTPKDRRVLHWMDKTSIYDHFSIV